MKTLRYRWEHQPAIDAEWTKLAEIRRERRQLKDQKSEKALAYVKQDEALVEKIKCLEAARDADAAIFEAAKVK